METLTPGHPHMPCPRCSHPFHCHPIKGMEHTQGKDDTCCVEGCPCPVEIFMVAIDPGEPPAGAST